MKLTFIIFLSLLSFHCFASEMYFLLVGNESQAFKKVKIGNKQFDHFDSNNPVPSVGARNVARKPFAFEVYFDDVKVREYEGYGMQIPFEIDEIESIKVESNSDELFVYVSVHNMDPDPKKYYIDCVFKKRVHSESNTSSVSLNLKDLRIGDPTN